MEKMMTAIGTDKGDCGEFTVYIGDDGKYFVEHSDANPDRSYPIEICPMPTIFYSPELILGLGEVSIICRIINEYEHPKEKKS